MDNKLYELLKDKKVFIFDYDGTLVDNNTLNFEVLKRYFKKYGKTCDLQTYMELRSLTAKELNKRCSEILGVDLPFEESVKEYLKLVDEVFGEAHQDCFPYVKELIKTFSDVQFVLLSNNLIEYLEDQLKKFGIYTRFNKIIGCASLNITKEEVYSDIEIMFGVKPEECVLFEDSQNYLIKGKQCKMTTVGIESRFNKNTLKADYIINADNS